MSTTKLKLTNPTDDELSAAVAEYVCGWRIHHRNTALWCKASEQNGLMESGAMGTVGGLRFSTSADAVLPLLEKHDAIITHSVKERDWRVVIEGGRCNSAPTFPRAACISLLRANGIEVEVTP